MEQPNDYSKITSLLERLIAKVDALDRRVYDVAI
jgi:hypothetical protein